MSGESIGILFVCLGNICRSPAAEGSFAQTVVDRSLAHRFLVDSCGTSAYHIGEPANSTSRATARRHGIELTSRARQFATEDFDRFAYIFAMDGSNYSDVCARARTAEDIERVWKFRSFDPQYADAMGAHDGNDVVSDNNKRNVKAPDVPDPYYGGPEGFEEVQQIMLRTSRNLLDWLVRKHGL